MCNTGSSLPSVRSTLYFYVSSSVTFFEDDSENELIIHASDFLSCHQYLISKFKQEADTQILINLASKMNLKKVFFYLFIYSFIFYYYYYYYYFWK